jgi:hypothetical protein
MVDIITGCVPLNMALPQMQFRGLITGGAEDGNLY